MNRIVSAEPLPGCQLKVAFNDGVSGIFAVKPERRGGVFLKLLDAKTFNAVTVNPDFGCVEWPGALTFAPTLCMRRWPLNLKGKAPWPQLCTRMRSPRTSLPANGNKVEGQRPGSGAF
jgi:hypothetical protein